MAIGNFTVRTTADPDSVAAYLADFRHQTEWRDDVLGCEVGTGEAGQDGTVYRQRVRQGRGTASRWVKAGISTDRRTISFQTLGDAPVQAAGDTRIIPDGPGSIVQSTIRISFTGIGHLLRPVVSRTLYHRMPEYQTALTHHLNHLATTPQR